MHTIDQDRVRSRIDNYITLDGNLNYYIPCARPEAWESAHETLQFGKEAVSPLGRAVGLANWSAVPAVMCTMADQEGYATIKITLPAISDSYIRYLHNSSGYRQVAYFQRERIKTKNPIKRLGYSLLEKTILWFANRGMNGYYEWLQEDNPKAQCDLVNHLALVGLLYTRDLLAYFEKKDKTAIPFPIDPFILDQIQRVPEETIEKAGQNLRLEFVTELWKNMAKKLR